MQYLKTASVIVFKKRIERSGAEVEVIKDLSVRLRCLSFLHEEVQLECPYLSLFLFPPHPPFPTQKWCSPRGGSGRGARPPAHRSETLPSLPRLGWAGGVLRYPGGRENPAGGTRDLGQANCSPSSWWGWLGGWALTLYPIPEKGKWRSLESSSLTIPSQSHLVHNGGGSFKEQLGIIKAFEYFVLWRPGEYFGESGKEASNNRPRSCLLVALYNERRTSQRSRKWILIPFLLRK